MTAGSDVIVAFERPPVVEVVAAVAFESSGTQDAVEALLSAFWSERLREGFPTLQRQPVYSPPVERFDANAPAQDVRVRFGMGAPPTRLWASSADGQELLQLQTDWMACNWRKVQPEAQYDTWARRRASFVRWFTELRRFVQERGVEDLKPYQCEVTYINHIRPGQTWRTHGDIGAVFSAATGRAAPVALDLEQLTAQATFLIPAHEEQDTPAGRLHVNVTPAFADGPGSPLYVLELTARGAPLDPSLEGTLRFLDLGRATIDNAFLSLTTAGLQAEWGIKP